ncbi:ureidoglycolate lyase [Denitrobaculum tricleocarpae]|uniref:Ureidoglycolate hydrolase n=1 Tax=Denitrobaculum tricleocarpae TaxID=2591009 RepID=A0A545TG61_9PROT|nr:ureidoglycolate lyase [Denitrobaculum tricleocarpae]TQV76224.1 hypothetical protein FKG95_21555 [Denitrobaculum tricleocarpae]
MMFAWNPIIPSACCHDRDVLTGCNAAVGGDYVLGWSCDPQRASMDEATVERRQVLLWHLNYHPDGGQLFFPLEPNPFVVPLALPGDDLKLEDVVAFWCDGSQGLYIHPGIWHEGIFPVQDRQRFFDKQGKVHARVSADLGVEFGCYLEGSAYKISGFTKGTYRGFPEGFSEEISPPACSFPPNTKRV